MGEAGSNEVEQLMNPTSRNDQGQHCYWQQVNGQPGLLVLMESALNRVTHGTV